jgi:hypothetical protein
MTLNSAIAGAQLLSCTTAGTVATLIAQPFSTFLVAGHRG